MTKDEVINLIEIERECEWLDFKATQYVRNNFDEFLKDVAAFANARLDPKIRRHIIIGVKEDGKGTKNIIGIENKSLDIASFQQLLNSNIEPYISLEFEQFDIDGKCIGIFSIYDCSQPPYVFKKNYNTAKLGDIYIRKGTYKEKATRNDLDFHFQRSFSKQPAAFKIEIKSILSSKKKLLERANKNFLPSAIRKKALEDELRKAIERERKSFMPKEELLPWENYYRTLSVNDIEKLIENVEKDFVKEDILFHFNHSNKLNFQILSSNSQWLEMSSIECSFENKKGLFIFKERITDPSDSLNIINTYPEITKVDNVTKAFNDIGDIRHHIPTTAFNTPLAILISPDYADDTVDCKVKLFAKNIESYFTYSIALEVEKI